MCFEMNQKERLDFLGKGIIIGLTYGVGFFVLAMFEDSIWGLLGIIFFAVAFMYHNHVLK